MKNYKVILFSVAMTGILAFFLRLQERSFFDVTTGLAVATPLHAVNAIIAVGCAALMVLPVLYTKKNEEGNFAHCFAANAAKELLLPVVGIFFLLGSAVQLLLSWFLLKKILLGLLGILLLLGAGSFLKALSDSRRGKAVSPSLLMGMICALALCMILSYQAESDNPVLLSYYVQILAQGAALLSFYHLGNFAFPPVKLRPWLWPTLVSVVLCFMAAADAGKVVGPLFYLGLAFLQLGLLGLYCRKDPENMHTEEGERPRG